MSFYDDSPFCTCDFACDCADEHDLHALAGWASIDEATTPNRLRAPRTDSGAETIGPCPDTRPPIAVPSCAPRVPSLESGGAAHTTPNLPAAA